MPRGVEGLQTDTLHTDYSTLHAAVFNTKGGVGGAMLTVDCVKEDEPFLRECPQRHPYEWKRHSKKHAVHPTPCVRTRYELRGHRARGQLRGNGKAYSTLFTMEIIRCELRNSGLVYNTEDRHIYADEMSVQITTT